MSGSPEIMKVRVDHGTVYVRLPLAWVRANCLRKGSYVIVRPGPDDSVILQSFEKGLKHVKRVGGD